MLGDQRADRGPRPTGSRPSRRTVRTIRGFAFGSPIGAEGARRLHHGPQRDPGQGDAGGVASCLPPGGVAKVQVPKAREAVRGVLAVPGDVVVDDLVVVRCAGAPADVKVDGEVEVPAPCGDVAGLPPPPAAGDLRPLRDPDGLELERGRRGRGVSTLLDVYAAPSISARS
ncbi:MULTISPECIES: hypothetical protein [Streptomyces]|uniref:hypothetical protein n=1 Tax=Streptomyces TaxID=1883 RepID=UPI0033DBFA36